MNEINRIVIPVGENSEVLPPCSLIWQGDELVDWVRGGSRYRLDGSMERSYLNYAYRFDHVVSSSNGEYIAVVEKLGTKGLLFKSGRFLREINRSYYCAENYEYPVAFLTLPDGQTGLIHCPDKYCKLEIEEAESGKRLTQRTTEPQDFFHSRLSVSADSGYIASSGWVWHPFEAVCIYSVEQVLNKPELLDNGFCHLTRSGVPVNIATLTGASSLVFTTTDDFYDADDIDEDEVHLLPPQIIGVYCASTQQIVSTAHLTENAGVIFPLSDEITLSLYGHPKLINMKDGKVIARWEELQSGEQMSCIIHYLPPSPLVAVDAAARRFAVASSEAITVIQLG